LNILLLNHYAGTPALGMEYRPYYLAREWVRAGHRVQIVAADHSHVRARQPATGEEHMDGIHYRWLPTPPYQGNGVRRLRNVMRYLVQVRALAPQLAAQFQPDAVIASSTYPMDNWVAQDIAARTRAAGRACRTVYEVHDLWPLSLIELSGMSPWHPFALICQAAERSGYRHSDAVVSMLPKVQAHMSARGLDPAKLHIVPNGISPEDWEGPSAPLREDVAAAIQRARAGAPGSGAASAGAPGSGAASSPGVAGSSRRTSPAPVLIGYAGSMGLPNALDDLLDAARLLADEPGQPPLRLVLVGDGHERARLQQRIQHEHLADRVTWLPPIPKAQVRAFLAAIDIAYIGWQRVPIYRFGIAPNKLMDYMMAGKPVLHAVEAGNDPVGEARCGLTVAPQDAQAIATGLRRLAATPAKEREAMGQRGRQFVLRHHSYPVLAQRFLRVLEPA
jgi:glycosyltransferase involved in cell wall biosynthesis